MASLRIHQDQENVNEQPKRPLRINKTSHAPVLLQNRAVLGLINKNQPRTRSQTQKKPETKLCQVQDKNVLVKQKVPSQGNAKSCFLIHEDQIIEDSKDGIKPKPSIAGSKVSSRLQNLPSAVTSLHRPPLQDLSANKSDEDSDSMDISIRSFSAISVAEKEVPRKPTLAQLIECEEYKDDIYKYLLEAETRHRPKPYYMKKQPDISYSMRAILIDWLVEVAEEYNLQTETLYLAVSYIDRFLSLMSVVRSKLQLVGTAAMFIAAKYEEIYPPDVGEFVYITDDTYTRRQVLRMEHLILKVLGFDMSVPTSLGFIVNYCTATKASDNVLYLAMYLSELALMEADPFLDFLPSIRAAASVALARHYLYESPSWTDELCTLTTYRLVDLKPCLRELSIVFEASPSHLQQAIREKYKSNARRNVSATTVRSVLNIR